MYVCVYYNKYKSLLKNITSIQNKLFIIWTLASIKREKKKKHNIKNRKLNCSLHTKKTNNINKLCK